MTPIAGAFDVLVLASLADVVTTRCGLRTGQLVEQNPLMRWSTRTTTRALCTKTAGLLVAGGCAALASHDAPFLTTVLILAGAIWTAHLAYGNWRLYRLLKQT